MSLISFFSISIFCTWIAIVLIETNNNSKIGKSISLFSRKEGLLAVLKYLKRSKNYWKLWVGGLFFIVLIVLSQSRFANIQISNIFIIPMLLILVVWIKIETK